MAVLRQVVPLALAFVLLGAPVSSASDGGWHKERRIEGQWDVLDKTVIEDEVVHVNGSILVHPGAELVLRHVDLVFEGDAFHALASMWPAPANGEVVEDDDNYQGEVTPGGVIRLISTEAGPTHLHSTGQNFVFANRGDFEVRGRPDAPVVVENVTGKGFGSKKGAIDPMFFDGLQISGPANVVDWLDVRGPTSGIGISSRGDTKISNTSVYLANFPFYFQTAENVEVRDSVVNGLNNGFYAFKSKNITIRDSKIGGFAFAGHAAISEVTLENNTIRGVQQGILLRDGGAYRILNNHVYGYEGSGIATSFPQPDPLKLTLQADIIGNTFDGAALDLGNGAWSNQSVSAMTISRADSLVIQNNRVINHNGTGVVVASSRDLELSGNVFERNTGLGAEVTLTRFNESDNKYGATPQDENVLGGFSGTGAMRIRVVDPSGVAVPNATLTVESDLAAPINFTTDARGETVAYGPFLEIANDGHRVEQSYRLTARVKDQPIGVRTIVPVQEWENVYVVTLGQETMFVGQAAKDATAPVGESTTGAQTVSFPVSGGIAVAGVAVLIVASVAIMLVLRRRSS